MKGPVLCLAPRSLPVPGLRAPTLAKSSSLAVLWGHCPLPAWLGDSVRYGVEGPRAWQAPQMGAVLAPSSLSSHGPGARGCEGHTLVWALPEYLVLGPSVLLGHHSWYVAFVAQPWERTGQSNGEKNRDTERGETREGGSVLFTESQVGLWLLVCEGHPLSAVPTPPGTLVQPTISLVSVRTCLSAFSFPPCSSPLPFIWSPGCWLPYSLPPPFPFCSSHSTQAPLGFLGGPSRGLGGGMPIPHPYKASPRRYPDIWRRGCGCSPGVPPSWPLPPGPSSPEALLSPQGPG